ncbi:hypothetical protein VOLCADRAFT_88274, partial [Volvox carteri f. nagariensis]
MQNRKELAEAGRRKDAPIPFGSPGAAPAAQGPQTNGNSFSRISSNGAPLQSWSAPSAAPLVYGAETSAAPVSVLALPTVERGIESGSSQTQAQQLGPSVGAVGSAVEPRSNLASAWPWESLSGAAPSQQGAPSGRTAANGPVGSVATGLSDDAAFFSDSLGHKEPFGQTPQAGELSLSSTERFGASAAGASSSSSSSLFTPGLTDSGSRLQHVHVSVSNAVAPEPALPSAATTNGLDLHGGEQRAWQAASSNKADKAWDSDISHRAPLTQAFAELKAQPDATRLDAQYAAAASGHSLGADGMGVVSQASASPDPGPLSKIPDSQSRQPTAGDSAEAAPPPSAVAAVTLDTSTSTGMGYGWATEVHQPETRPPWLAYSAAAAPSISTPPVALFEGSGSTITPTIGALPSGSVHGHLVGHVPQPAPELSGSAAHDPASSADVQLATASLRPTDNAGVAGTEVTSSASGPVAAAAASSVPCYEQLSDSYLGTSGADANALSSAAGPAPPPVPQEGRSWPSERLGDGAAAAGVGAASPTLPFSAGADGSDIHATPNLAAAPPTAPAPLPGPTHEPVASQAAAAVAEDMDSLPSTTQPARWTSYAAPSANVWTGPGVHEAHPPPPSNTFSYGSASEQPSGILRMDGAPAFGISSTSSVGLAGGLDARDNTGPQLPSFLRGVAQTPATTMGVQDRSALATAGPLMPGGSLGQSQDSVAASGFMSDAAPEEFVTAPSFSTSFLPAPLGSLPPLPQAAAAPRPRPAGTPAPATSVANGSMPHASAATTYRSAYTPSAVGDVAAPHEVASAVSVAAHTSSTSSFLESYLDNLLSTMSAAPSREGPEDPHAQPHSHAADPFPGTNTAGRGGADQSSTDTSRHSHRGDVSADARGVSSGRHAAPGLGGEGVEEGLGSGAGTISAGGLVAGVGGMLEGAGGSGRGNALPHVDSVPQLRSHHSRRVSVDSAGVLSLHSQATGGAHTAGANAHGPGGGSSGVSQAQFAALQQHIDELTEEKLALMRGLQQQTRINEQLAEENEELMRQYNARGAAMEELQRKMKQYEQELEAQALSLEGFSEERQAARSSYVEASSRAQALAAEVVSLEAQVLQLKSSVLKAERTADEAHQRARKLEKQVEVLTREAQERAQELQQTQLKGRNLVVKLKQTEAKLEAAEEKLALQAALAGTSSVLPNGHLPPAAQAPPPKPPTAEQEVQCDLASELAATVEAPPQSGGGSTCNLRSEDVAIAAAIDQRPDCTADGASTSSGAPADAAGAGPLALVRHPSAAVSTDIPDTPDQLLRVDWEAVRPQRDAPSTVVAERALACLDDQALRAAARGRLPEDLDAVALQLARWLPAGPVSGGDPMAVMVEEELRLMQSIYELMENFEQSQEATARQVVELQARVVCLTRENEELRHKLELQTQRLELQMQGTTTGPPLSLHQ